MLLMLCVYTSNAQVGIGNTAPDPSAMLDITSTTSGLLTPRMTTVQRLAIVTPVDGLIVYDTTMKFFFHYNSATSSWIRINSEVNGRLNFKRIKSTDVLATVLATELIAGGSKYKLDTNTLYEINGTVTFDKPIELNNAYIQGLDSGDDKIISGGNTFDGATGGTIKGLTIVSSAKVFNLSGNAAQNLIFRDCIVANSASVGTINNFGLVFLSVVQFSGNTTGITYSNISQLLLSNLGWFGNNLGTFEKLTGAFGLVQKQGGFSDLSSGTFGFDVSSNPTISADAVLESVVFTGDATGVKYVNPYPLANRYSGYNFSNSWNVRSTGIPNETDGDSVGSFFMDYAVGSGASTLFSGNVNTPTAPKKVEGISSSDNLFRFSAGAATDYNKLIYLGKKKRFFQVTGSISFQVPSAGTWIVYIAKNGTVISQSKIYGRGNAANDIVVLPLNALVELSNSQYVEVYIQRYNTGGFNDGIITPNMTITIK